MEIFIYLGGGGGVCGQTLRTDIEDVNIRGWVRGQIWGMFISCGIFGKYIGYVNILGDKGLGALAEIGNVNIGWGLFWGRYRLC